jgi:hypothetical protein
MKHIYNCLCIAVILLTASESSSYSQTFRVDTIQYQGDTDYYINLVMLGDGFLDSELATFRTYAEEYLNLLFTVDPFSRYRNFFNTFSISVPSNEQGAAVDPGSPIDNYFGSTFNYAGIERLLVPTNNSAVTNVLASNLPDYDQVFMLVNSATYGGSGGWVATASLHVDSKEIALHELGHSFADLADEYWAGAQYAAERKNMTQETDLEKLKWRNWHGDEEIGLYAHAESPTWYRPHEYCLMRYLDEILCAVCREGVIESIYALAPPVKDYEPITSDIELPSDSLVFKLDLTYPEPNTLHRTWHLNGTLIGEDVDSVFVRATDLGGGVNKVLATVTDISAWLRPLDTDTYHQTEIEWNVTRYPLGIEPQTKLLNHAAFSIYPNPVHDQLNVQILGDHPGESSIAVFDAQGSQVQTCILEYPGKQTLDLSSLDPGLYVIRIFLEGEYFSSRRIIKY